AHPLQLVTDPGQAARPQVPAGPLQRVGDELHSPAVPGGEGPAERDDPLRRLVQEHPDQLLEHRGDADLGKRLPEPPDVDRLARGPSRLVPGRDRGHRAESRIRVTRSPSAWSERSALTRYPTTPSRVISSMSCCREEFDRTSTGISRVSASALRLRSTSRPPSFGISRSSRTRSGFSARASRSPSSPSTATSTRNPRCWRHASHARRRKRSSSTTSTRLPALAIVSSRPRGRPPALPAPGPAAGRT